MPDNEIFPIVDEQGNTIGSATRLECHSGSHLLHPVVHLHVFDRQGRIYLQRRSMDKFIQPGKWDTAVGGHRDLGEDTMQALVRETSEELGFSGFTPVKLFSYILDNDIEREWVDTFYTVTDRQSFDYDPGEVMDGRFWTLDEVRRAIGTGVLTPNFEQEFEQVADIVGKAFSNK